MKRWHKEVIALGAALLVGLALDGAMWKWGISDTTWKATAVAPAVPGATVLAGGTEAAAQVTVTNAGHSRDGYPGCFVWGFDWNYVARNWQHVASGYAEMPVILNPGQSWMMTVYVQAEQGYPANVVTKVASFTAACYDGS